MTDPRSLRMESETLRQMVARLILDNEHRTAYSVADEILAALGLDDPEQLARRFHEAYERLAPGFGYKTRDASAVPWEDVPAQNKALMIATVEAAFLATEGPQE